MAEYNRNDKIAERRNDYFMNDKNWNRALELFGVSCEDENPTYEKRVALVGNIEELKGLPKVYDRLAMHDAKSLLKLAQSLEQFKDISALYDLQVLCYAAIADHKLANEKFKDESDELGLE